MARQGEGGGSVPYYSDPSIGGGSYGGGVAYGSYADPGGAGGGGGHAPVGDIVLYRAPDDSIQTPRPVTRTYTEPATNTAAPVTTTAATNTAMKRADGKASSDATAQGSGDNNSLVLLAGVALLVWVLTKD